MSRMVLDSVRTCTSTICRVSLACCSRPSAVAQDALPGCSSNDCAARSTSDSAAVEARPCSRASRSQPVACSIRHGRLIPSAMADSTSTMPSPKSTTDLVAAET